MNSIFYLFLYTNLNLAVIIHIYRMESVYTHIETEHIKNGKQSTHIETEQYYDCYEYKAIHVETNFQNKTRP